MMAMDRRQVRAAVEKAPTDRQSQALDKAREMSRRAQALLAAAGEAVPASRWHVLTIRNGFDKSVDKALSDGGVCCWMPTRIIAQKRRGGRPGKPLPDLALPAMPGYLFIKTLWSAEVWAALRTVDGIVDVLGGAFRPAPLKDDTVLKLRAFIDEDPNAIMILTNALRVGEQVMIDQGPFARFVGIVDRVNEDRVWLEVMLLGQTCLTELGLAQVSKI